MMCDHLRYGMSLHLCSGSKRRHRRIRRDPDEKFPDLVCYLRSIGGRCSPPDPDGGSDEGRVLSPSAGAGAARPDRRVVWTWPRRCTPAGWRPSWRWMPGSLAYVSTSSSVRSLNATWRSSAKRRTALSALLLCRSRTRLNRMAELASQPLDVPLAVPVGVVTVHQICQPPHQVARFRSLV